MHKAITTPLMTSQNDGIVSGFSDLSDDEFYRTAAGYLKARDVMAEYLREFDRQISAACRDFGNRNSMWGVNPTILRRELRLRGLSV